jgi:hypothetical protein
MELARCERDELAGTKAGTNARGGPLHAVCPPPTFTG